MANQQCGILDNGWKVEKKEALMTFLTGMTGRETLQRKVRFEGSVKMSTDYLNMLTSQHTQLLVSRNSELT